MKWYQKTWAIILFLIIFFPVGLFLMWRYSSWNKTVKGVVTGFFVLIVISNIVNGGNNKTETNSIVKNSQVQEEKTKDTEKKQEEKTDNNKENKKEQAVEPGITKEYIESKLSSEQVEILNIENSGDNYYTISFKVRDVVSDSYYKKNILSEIKQICQLLTESGLVEGNEFFFEAKGPGTDKYGNDVEMNYATAFVKGEELAKCKYDNLSSEDFEKILQSFGLNQSLQ